MACALNHTTGLGCEVLQSQPSPLRKANLLQSATSMLHTLRLWNERNRQRQALLALDAHQLADIGLTRDDALREASKPFWA